MRSREGPQVAQYSNTGVSTAQLSSLTPPHPKPPASGTPMHTQHSHQPRAACPTPRTSRLVSPMVWVLVSASSHRGFFRMPSTRWRHLDRLLALELGTSTRVRSMRGRATTSRRFSLRMRDHRTSMRASMRPNRSAYSNRRLAHERQGRGGEEWGGCGSSKGGTRR